LSATPRRADVLPLPDRETDLPDLRGLLGVTRLLGAAADLPTMLDEMARLLGECLGYETVTISFYRPAWGDFAVEAACAPETSREQLLGKVTDRCLWRTATDERFRHRGVYLVPEEDALVVPVPAADGQPLAMVRLDHPAGDSRPTDDQFDILVAGARHAAAAVEAARSTAREARHRAALECLLEVSAHLTQRLSVGAILQLVCDGIRSSLGFDRVSIQLAAAGGFEPRAAAGWRPGDRSVELTATTEDLELLLDPAFEIEGCYVVPRDEAHRRLGGPRSPFESTFNGRGPHAWNHHWLVVPLVRRDGTVGGFVWADDPVDRLVPERERLQVLRMFANQATTALDFGTQFAELDSANEARRALIQASPVAIVELDTDKILRSWNAAAERLFGWTAEEVIGGPSPFVPPERADDYRHNFEAIMRGESIHEVEGRRLRKDGTEIDVTISAAPVRDREGEVRGIVALVADASDRHRLETELRQSQRLEAVGRLAGGIAHDFNNLLTAISGYGELALAKLGDEPGARHDIEEMKRAADRAASLTHQLLAFSRRQVLQPTVLDLNTVVGEMHDMLGRLIGDHIELRTALTPALVRTRADVGQVEQVVVNLAINARDAMPGGGRLTIETFDADLTDEWAALRVGALPGAYVGLAVSDTGTGMDGATRQRVFEPFFTTKAPGEGTGLGLATVYGIVKQSGGYVSVYSEPGRGSSFKVYLPRTDAEPEPVQAAAEPAAPAPGSETILLVEDEAVVRALVQEMLETHGYQVLEAENGARAIEVAAAHDGPIDLLLTDVVMPGMSGREAAEIISAERPGLRVLYTSGYTQNAIASQGTLDEGVAFIEKPFTLGGLSQKVRQVLDA
jgi:PAS domain S-box-containing protein